MTTFSGAAALNIEQTAIALLKAHLALGLSSAPHADTFAAYNGVRLLDDDTLAEEAIEEFSMQPRVFLSVDDHKRQPFQTTGRRHEFKITAEILTSDDCFKAEPKLRDALQNLVDEGKKALRVNGFFEAACDPNPERTNDTNKINPLVISGTVYTTR